MAIDKSSLLSGYVDALSAQNVIDFIKNKMLAKNGRVFTTSLTTEQLAGQYAYESLDKSLPAYEIQIEFNLDFLSENGININYSKATDHALALLAEEEND